MNLKNQLTEQAAEGFKQALKTVLEGATEDLQNYAAEMATDAIEIAMYPEREREELMAELSDQAQLLAEKNRLNAVDAGWNVVRSVANTAIQISVRMAATALVAAI